MAAILFPPALAAVRVRRRWLPGWSGAPAWLAEITTMMVLVMLVAQLLGAVGLLERVPLVLGCVLVAAVAIFVSGRGEPAPVGDVTPAPARGRLAAAVSVGAVALVAAVWSAPVASALTKGMFAVDTLWYHLPTAARFAQDGSTAHIHFLDKDPVTAYFPGGSALVHTIGMVAFERDLLSPLINVGWALLALLAAWCIGRPRGIGHLTLLATAVVLVTPTMVETQPGEAYSDTPGLAALLAAIALLVNGGLRGLAFALAAAATGIALGAKFTLIAPVVGMTLAVFVLLPRGQRLRYGAGWVGLVLALGGFWYGRNFVHLGNPMPAEELELVVFSLPAPRISTPTTTVIQYAFDWRIWDDYFLPGLNRSYGPLWWLLVALTAGGLAAAAVRGRPLERALAAIAAVGFAGFIVAPQFLGPEGNPFVFTFNLRYTSAVMAIALVLLALVVGGPDRVHRRVVGGVLLFLLLGTQLDSGIWPTGHDRVAIAVGIVALVLGAIAYAFGYARIRPLAVTALAVVTAGLVAIGYPIGDNYLDDRYAEASITDPAYPRNAWTWARDQHDQRIALTGTFLQYPLYGTDLSNYVQFVGREGPENSFLRPKTCRSWREALADGRYDYVVVAPDGYPVDIGKDAPEDAWTRTDPGASVVTEEAGDLVVFRLSRPPDPDAC